MTGLVMENISKRFSSVAALSAVTLTIGAGEIHGLIGENGAGKSTLIKILAGVYQADSGRVLLEGKTLPLGKPAAIEAAGIRVIHQELNLIPHFTVAESVFLGQEICSAGRLKRQHMAEITRQFFRERWQIDIDPRRLIRDLSLAERKLVQIARGLIDGKARLVVFDEPTAPLESHEASLVSDAILRLKSQGIAILYISHYLNEIATLCDRATVLRNGEVVAYAGRDLLQDTDAIIRLMVGRDIGQLYAPRPSAVLPGDSAPPLLSVRNLSDGHQLQDISFAIQPGEIVGVAGLLGAGRDVLIDLLYGLQAVKRGEIHVDGQRQVIRSPRQAIRAGMALVPRDRRHQGLILPFSAADNINLASLPETARFGWERRQWAENRAREWIENLSIRPATPALPVRYMSGGNQQKVILARWLGTAARLFILDEPTLGVDVGARSDIYQRTRQLAEQGRAVLVSSSDAAELLGLCDRILVMWRGSLAVSLSTRGLTMDALLAAINGGQDSQK